ncbi:hypothetical protein GXM_08392 [Nostoc sphaeroides CCNUC1]|uniref:Uncharacterized protein n=1 Tax=Nostoc sphaeroides CCNUC1 TaxID=2653204 RepID=A0A5P8WDR5_9NOSO|nr:hypothetical protein GXM_08392 [Nostoc sphaeroides CCNUC1]
MQSCFLNVDLMQSRFLNVDLMQSRFQKKVYSPMLEDV